MSQTTVHFSVEGSFLTDLARDLFTEDTPKKAVNFLTESLEGLPEHLAIEIVLGKKKLTGVDNLLLEDDDCETNSGIPLSFESAWNRLSSKYLDQVSYLLMLKKRISILGTVTSLDGSAYRSPRGVESEQLYKTFSFATDKENYFKRKLILDDLTAEMLYAGNQIGKTILDLPIGNLQIYGDEYRLPDLSERNPASFKPSVLKDISFEDLIKISDEDLAKIFDDDYRQLNVLEVMDEFKEDFKEDSVNSYIKAQHKIDEKLKEKIKPNPITDINNAGWLAPNGDWYGLDGEISNQLHNQLADALVEAGIVPESESDNPDGWLCKTGWARVHDGKVQFEGYSQAKYCLGPRIELSQKQIDSLAKYAQHLNPPVLWLGLGGIVKKPDSMVSGARLGFISQQELEKKFEF